ncbi:tumor necrosis factor ligand superfamily member 14 [Varanus komodoensis]|uniref:tumor necrosis factor ligand superfamily member 14 n=1 Tax=Varanus komodoensis TaxID=61221 RepID=UPI001CF7CCC0|nr:tumor necrosis factor ligand superfamily member 14 [Varanus komodoensis]
MEHNIRYPSVFVVDAPQQNPPFVLPVYKSQKKWQHGKLLLGILLVLMLAALAIQAYYLICFRKELDKAAAQAEAGATYEKSVQGHTPTAEKPAAHLTLGASISAAANGALLWEHKKGVAFLREMGYKGGSLICNKSGHYYVYSNLFLGHSDCPVTHQSYLFVTHTIYKRTSQYPEEMELLTNSIPYCNLKDSQLWSHNSFLAGVVHLEENEEVFIKVSQMHLVRVSEESRTYFGTFMI